MKRTPKAPGTKGRRPDPFTIVGIGTSAGGLEALEQFFAPVAPDSGLGYVVVQHLDPTREGMLVELLGRGSPIPVVQATDAMVVEPDRVHVIPPNAELTIEHGTLRLHPPADRRGLRLPIDHFLCSLAQDQGERALGVILSGMGSDGTSGVREIKAHAGAVFVQAPASAKFDAMPRSAIDAGLADVVAPAEELAARITQYLAHARDPRAAASASDGDEVVGPSGIAEICRVIMAQTGHDFSKYKSSTMARRIERRMGLHQLPGTDAYVRHLSESPQEIALLFKELLIGVTSFFRDAAVWEHLRTHELPELVSRRLSGGTLRVWVPGCSTGEEAYSLAILFREILAELRPRVRLSLQIFATDLDTDALDRARRGTYPREIEADVSEERLHRFFVRDEHGYRVRPEIRESVIFAIQNVIADPPFTKLDLVSCRNLFIYLSSDVQRKILRLFHYSLLPGGLLVMGSAESIGESTEFFTSRDPRTHTFHRREGRALELNDYPTTIAPRNVPSVSEVVASEMGLQASADQLLLDRYAPASVVTNELGDILYVRGRTAQYLAPAAGKANWNLHAMVAVGLRHPLGAAFQRAIRDRNGVVTIHASLEGEGVAVGVDVSIEPLDGPDDLRGAVLVVFTPTTLTTPRKGRGVARISSGEELRRAHEDLERTRAQMQTSQEELRSANEELQSTNEELQSTNEEVTTSKEEMQSMNEELQTLNQELQGKLDELSRANNDMRNLLESTDIATLFLDDALRVRRFTTRMTKIINLIPGDINRPITDLASNLRYPALVDDIRNVLATLVPVESSVETSDGRWFSIRILPYRTIDNRIDGVVITFMDVTVAKTLEARLREEGSS